jgi:hypothetical protein
VVVEATPVASLMPRTTSMTTTKNSREARLICFLDIYCFNMEYPPFYPFYKSKRKVGFFFLEGVIIVPYAVVPSDLPAQAAGVAYILPILLASDGVRGDIMQSISSFRRRSCCLSQNKTAKPTRRIVSQIGSGKKSTCNQQRSCMNQPSSQEMIPLWGRYGYTIII